MFRSLARRLQRRSRRSTPPTVKLFEAGHLLKCVEALVGGTVDAVTTDNVILAGFAAQPQYAGKLKVVGKPFSTEKYGVGLKKGDTELCNKVHTALDEDGLLTDPGRRLSTRTSVHRGSRSTPATNPPKPDPARAA